MAKDAVEVSIIDIDFQEENDFCSFQKVDDVIRSKLLDTSSEINVVCADTEPIIDREALIIPQQSGTPHKFHKLVVW